MIKILIYILLLSLSLHASNGASPEKKEVTLQLFWKHQFEFAGYYAAKEKGFYKEAGFEVDFKEYEAGLNVTKEVTSARAQFGTASSSALLNYLSGEPVVLLANIFKHSALVILADKKAGIRTPQDLHGKRLMLSEHEKSAVEFKSFFSKNHIDTSKITFIEHNFDPFSINDGRVDAMSAYITNQPYILRKNNIEFSILDPVNYGGDFYGDSLFTSSQMLQKDPEAVRAFTKASIKGWQYAINHTDEIIELILSKYNTQNKSREALEYEAQETKKLILADVYEIGSIDKDKIQRIVDVMQDTKTVDNKTIANNLNIDKFILDMDLPTVNVIRFFDEPPFTLNSKDKNEGYTYELLEYLLKSVNLKPNYIDGYTSYKAMLEAMESGEADILTTISTDLNLADSSNISKTKAVLKTPFVLVGRSSDTKLSSIKGAFGKKVAVVKGYVQDQYLSRFPQVTKVYVSNNDEGFKALRSGKVDYYLNNRANTEYVLKKSFETDLKIVAQLSTKNFPLFSISLGINKKNKELVSLLNNALQDMPYNEIKKLKDKWLVYSDDISKNTIALSKEERLWIDKHPLINVGVEMDWAPYDYVDENGNYAGIAKEYLDIISKKTGIKFEYKSGQTWSQLLESIKQKKIDMLPSLYFSKERSQFIEFSDSYMSTVNYLYVKDDNKGIKSVKDINNKKIAVLKDNLVIKDIKKLYKNVEIVEVDSVIDALNAVLTDKADGYVDLNYVVQHNINKNFLLGLRAVGAVDIKSTQLHMGVQKELKPLAQIINKALSGISEKEKLSIYRQWSFDAQKEQANNLNLTNKEKKWIQNNPNVSFTADPNWLPFEAFNESGKYIGIAADHLNVIEESTSLHFNKIISKNWADAVDMATNSKVDVISGVVGEKFSNNYNAISYLDNNIVVVMDKDSGVIDNPNEELSGKKIAIIKDYGYVGEVFEKYPNLNFTEVENVQEGLNGVATGKFDAMFGSVALLSYSMETMGLYQLKIVGKTDVVMKLALFVKKGKPELFSVVSKALKNITTQNQNKILSRWFREVEGNKKVLLTQEEKEWLRNHPTIKIASEVDYAPFDFQIDGKPVGYSIDVIEMIAKRIGFKIEFVTETWDKLHEKAKNKEIDLIHTMKQTPERQKYLTMTKPYVITYDAIFTNVDTQDISSFKDFTGKRIGVGKGENSAQVFEKIKDRDFELVLFSSYTEQLKALSFGKIDALVLDRSVGLYTAKENGIYNLKVVGSLEGIDGLMDQSLFRMGVRDDYPILRDIIQKGLDSIDEKTKQELTSKWLGATIEKKVGDEKFQDVKLADILPLKEIAITFFIAMLLLAAVIIYYKKTKKEDISIKGPIGIFVALFLILISISTLVSLHNMKNKHLEDIESSLNIVLNTTYNTLSIWADTNKNILSFIANNAMFASDVESYINGNSEAKESIKEYMFHNKELINNEKYYLISLDYKILMSNNETIIPNRVIQKYYKPYLDKAWQSGKSFIPPFKNKDITSEKIYLLNRVVSDNKTVAILAIAIDPIGEFSEIINQGRMGKSGETYAVNKDIDMITLSRFNSELKEIGIVKKDENSFLNLKIKTPDDVLTDASKDLLNKMSGSNVAGYLDYRGEKVFGTWRWLDEFNIGLISEIDEKEAIGQFSVMERVITVVVFSIVLFAIMLTFLIIWISAKSKKALEGKNAELNRILESFDENVIASRTDLKGKITYASKAFCKISGYTQDEVIGKPHNIVRHPDMPREAFEDMWTTLKSGKVWRGEVKNLKKDGGFYWTSVVAESVYDNDGVHTGYSAIRQDITAQKEVEELSRNLEDIVQERTKNLQESQERFRALFDSAPDGMNILKDGVYIDCNKATLELYGVATREEFISTSPSKYSPEYQDNGIKSELFAKEKIQEAMEKGSSTFEWKYARLDTKEERYAEIILSPIYLDNELHVYSVVRDITERKELENQVLQNQEQMTFVSNYANLGFWTFNPQIGDLLVNDIFVNMLGYDSHEVLKSGYEDNMFKPFKDGLAFWEQLLHPDDVEHTNKIITAHINGETDLYKVDYRMRRADGTWMWSTAIGRIAEYDEDGKPIVFNGVNVDISEAKEAQQKIEEAQQKFETMVSNVPGAIYRAVDDSEWPIIYLSDEIQKITGYPASDFMENKIVSFSTIMHPDDVEPMGKIITEQFAKGKSFQIDYRVIAKNGEIKWVRSQGQSVKTDSGEAFIDGVLIDITQAKEAEAKIELLTELVHGSLKSASVGAWWVDFTEEDTFHALKNTAEMIGIDFKAEDSDACVISEWGKVLQSTATLSDEYKKAIDDTFENFTGAISGKYESYHAVYPIAYSNGEVRWIEARADVPKRDKDGNALLMTGTLIDITDIKKAQVKIEQQQQQFESMVSNTPGVIYRINESDRSIVFMSEQISQLTGYPVSYFDSEDKYYNLINPDSLEKIISIANQEKNSGDHAALEYRITHKDGSIRWVRNQRNVIENENGELLNDGTIFDITDVIDAQEKIEESRLFLNTLLDSQEQIIITTDGIVIHSINEAFKNFYGMKDIKEFADKYDCICDTFDVDAPEGYLQKDMDGEKWIEYILNNPNQAHKVQIVWDEKVNIFSVTAAKLPIKDEHLLSAVFTNITLLEAQRTALEELHEKISDSIDYASLIQHALIPNENVFSDFFKDCFTIWKPRDVVGGDIYLAEQISEDEILMMVVDCTGHGVPGAFVTMLVKAVERQIMTGIAKNADEIISPAKMLSTFNRSIKLLLQQESDDSISNAGFDAGILYYNKKEKIVRFAGAEIALYMIQDGNLDFIKGDRHSIGYKKSDVNFEFKDHDIEVKEGMQFYITTDGFIDQNGGDKGFPFGKKRFKNIISENHDLEFEKQKEILLEELKDYQQDYETNDDVTLVGIRV